MIKNIKVEAEHNELILENSHGDKVIIPASKREWVKAKLAEGCHDCIDGLVAKLPTLKRYAEGGTVIPEGEKIKVTQPDSSIKEYDIESKEYAELYNSGHLMSYDKTTDSYYAKPLDTAIVSGISPESTRVKRQVEYIKNNNFETTKNNYAVINKKSNKIYYYSPKHELIAAENLITGASNFDRDYSISMKDYFDLKENKGKTHDDYFAYLKANDSKVTPAGHFTIASLREGVNTNQKSKKVQLLDYTKDIISGDKIGQRNEDIETSRTIDYGPTGQMFTLRSDEGVYSSKAIHGTGNPNRIAIFDKAEEYNNPIDRDASNGCINVDGNSICFDTLSKKSSIYILPENSDELVTVKKKSISNGDVIFRSKSKIYNSLKAKGLEVDDDMVNFISAVHGAESSFGTNKLIKTQDKLPFFKSDGEFQINKDTFEKYLPKNYTNTFDMGVEAVYNFYKQNKTSPELLYGLYNTGEFRESPNNEKFMKIYGHVKDNY